VGIKFYLYVNLTVILVKNTKNNVILNYFNLTVDFIMEIFIKKIIGNFISFCKPVSNSLKDMRAKHILLRNTAVTIINPQFKVYKIFLVKFVLFNKIL